MPCVLAEPDELLSTIKKSKHKVIPESISETLTKPIAEAQNYKKAVTTTRRFLLLEKPRHKLTILYKEHIWAIKQWITQNYHLEMTNIQPMRNSAFEIEASIPFYYHMKGTIKFYYIYEYFFASSMYNAYVYVPKGTNDGVSQCVSVCAVAYSMEHLRLTSLGLINIIVLDNVRLHKVQDILKKFLMIDTGKKIGQQQLATGSMHLLFLTTYFSFLKPIEEVFGWLKQVVKLGVRAQNALDNQIAYIEMKESTMWKALSTAFLEENPLSDCKWPVVCKAHVPQNPGIEIKHKIGSVCYWEMVNWESNFLIAQSGAQLLAVSNNRCGTLACCS
ncbi:hypothetical protein DSO57_1005769 [Entomophthora muscae]|uniref:Uncharacterized protein n=1 Tax=Entomophthora muscae TaxID=34485 RepID=A0ACC2U641_9FUNG|nr:hypothetical protein DSO57_1005769 [Entomophthora muscae]